MSITTTTHLNFDGTARPALEFYRSVFGGEIALFTYEAAQRSQDVDDPQLLTWGGVTAPNGFAIMAYDVQRDKAYDPGTRAFFVSVRGTSVDEVTALWAGLSEGGSIETDLGPAGWSPLYGMVTDKFGVTWVMDLEVSDEPS